MIPVGGRARFGKDCPVTQGGLTPLEQVVSAVGWTLLIIW